MEIRKNKKGIATLSLIFIIFAGFFLVVFLFALSYGMDVVDNSISILNGTIGNYSFNEVYKDTLQPGIISMKTTFPQILGIGVLIGMIIVMLFVGYNAERINYVWMLNDIIVLIVAEAIAVLVKLSFINYINGIPAFIEIARDTLPQAAKFILNLPVIIPIVGALIMIVTYMVTPEKEKVEGLPTV